MGPLIKIVVPSLLKMQAPGLGTATYAYNPSYLGSSNWEDTGLRPSQKKMLARPHLNLQARYGGSDLWSQLWRSISHKIMV